MTNKVLKRAFRLACRAIVLNTDNTRGTHPHCKGICPIRDTKRACCSDDPDCDEMLMKEFIRKATAELKAKGGKI